MPSLSPSSTRPLCRRQAAAEKKKREEEEEALRNLNPTERIHTAEGWADALDRAGITLVAWLDPQADAVQHKAYLRVLKAAHRRIHKTTKVRFVWVDGAQQPALADHFGAAGNMPAVVFVNPKKGWWKFMIGAFAEDRIWRFAREQLLKGAGKPLNPEGLPAFVEEVAPCCPRGGGGALEGGEVTPPPCPDGRCQAHWLLTDSNRSQPLWQPPPTAYLTAFAAASEAGRPGV